jgi:hypothetical protein
LTADLKSVDAHFSVCCRIVTTLETGKIPDKNGLYVLIYYSAGTALANGRVSEIGANKEIWF